MIKVRLKGDVLDELLTRANILRKDFAAKIEINTSHLSQLIKGDKFPSPRLRMRIQAELIGKTFDELFEIVDPVEVGQPDDN